MTRISPQRERGGARLKTLAAVLVLFALIYSGWMIIPPYFDNYQLQDSMENEARFAAVNRRTDDDIREDIFRRIKDLGIPARRQDIRVDHPDGSLRITVNYEVSIDLLGYPFQLPPFHPQADNRTI